MRWVVCLHYKFQANKQKLTFELVGRIRCPMSMFHIQIVTRIKHTFCCGGQINVRDSQWISRHTQLTQPKNETSNHLINLTKYMAICTAVSDAATATVSADISYCIHTPFVYRIQSALHLSSFISFWVSRVAHIVVGMGWDVYSLLNAKFNQLKWKISIQFDSIVLNDTNLLSYSRCVWVCFGMVSELRNLARAITSGVSPTTAICCRFVFVVCPCR